MRGRFALVVALFAALSGTTARAQSPTPASDEFGAKVTVSEGRSTDLAATVSIEGVMYLSDVSPSAVTNGHGPLELDTSNGEALAGDGEAITLNGATFLKGLGTHASSRVRYVLPADCRRRFRASVGVDDEVGPRGSVIFRVFTDTTKVYDSGLMTGKSQTRLVDVPLAGADQLQLVVTKGGNDGRFDHADWADARIECGRATQSGVQRGLGVLRYSGTLSLLGLAVVAGSVCMAGVALRRRERR